MSAVDTKFYEKKKSSTFITSCVFLTLVVIITGAMYFFNSKVDWEITSLEAKKTRLDSSVEEIQKDPQVQIYKIYQGNKEIFDQYEKRSQIPLFVSHLKKQFLKYDISATGFQYSDGKVNTDLSAGTNETWFAYEKIVRMMDEYSADEKAIFEMQTTGSFSWYDRINFPVQFILK